MLSLCCHYAVIVVIYEVFYAVIMLSLCCHYAVIAFLPNNYIASRYFSLDEEEENQRGSGSQVVQNDTFDIQITHKSITI